MEDTGPGHEPSPGSRERCGVMQRDGCSPTFFLPTAPGTVQPEPHSRPQQDQGGAWCVRTGMGSSELRGHRAEGWP